MHLDKKSLKRIFPNLADEIDDDRNKVDINSVRVDNHDGEKAVSMRFAHYVPDAIDFIRRCNSEKQAEEIITYLERRGEIGFEQSQKLREQLRMKGVRSFGPKKEEDYYLKHGER